MATNKVDMPGLEVDKDFHMVSRDEAPEPNKDTMYTPAPESTIEAFKEAGIPCE